MNKAQKFELTYLKKEKVSRDAYSFYFDRVKRGSAGYFDFLPGQYLKLFLDIKNPDDRGSSRYFTISSSPTDKDFLVITTRIVKSSFKIRFSKLKKGEKVNAFGPLGYFDFDFKDKRNQVFLAGGIGITPAHSVLNFVSSKKIKSKITLIANFSTRKDIIYYNEFKKIEKKNPNIKIIYSLTKENKFNEGFEKGRISEKLIKKYSPEFKSSKFFAIGSEAFEFSMFELLTKMGIKEENIFKENFPGY